MPDSSDIPPQPTSEDRRTELRVPASTLGDVRTRLIGGTDFALLNYTPRSLYGQSYSRLLVGARVSVRLVTDTLNAVVKGRVVRSALTTVNNGVPSYEVAVSLEDAVDWSRAETAAAASSSLDAEAELVPVTVIVPSK